MKEKCLSIHTMLPGFLFAVTLFVFVPAGVYFANMEEFWFPFENLIPYLFFFTAAAFALITVFSCIIPRKVSDVFRAGVYACSFLFWLQGMMLLEQKPAWLNTLLWAAIIFAFVFLAICLKNKFGRIAETAACILLFAQLVTTGFAFVHYQAGRSEEPRYLSRRNELTISSGDNTVVFVPEKFDGNLLKQLLEEYPEETSGLLEDFTFYPNVTAGVNETKYAIPHLLTGEIDRRKESYPEYLKWSFEVSPLIRELEGQKYSTGFYTSGLYMDVNREDVLDNTVKGVAECNSGYGLAKQFMGLAASKCMPSAMTSLFRTQITDFEQWKNEEIYSVDDAILQKRLTAKGLTASEDKPCFRFYHMSGVNSAESDIAEEQGRAALRMIVEYIDQMKKQGVYERAIIIVMADSGHPAFSDHGSCPLLLVKLPGVTHPLEISDIPLSADSAAEIMAEALRRGLTTLEPWRQKDPLYFYDQSENAGVLNLTEYTVVSSGNERALVRTGVVYHGNTARKTYKYTLNTELFFDARATAEDYQVSGFYEHENGFTWTSGNDAQMLFELPEEPGDLEMVLRYRTFNGLQSVGVWVNEKLVDIYYAEGEMEQLVTIPKGTVTGTKLRIRLELPDARSPYEVGQSNDKRQLALAMESIVIREAEIE